MNNENINELIKIGVDKALKLQQKYGYPDNITHLLYLIIPAFIIKYGINEEKYIIDCFNNVPILIDDRKDQVYQAYYRSIPAYNGTEYITNKGIVLNNYENISLMQLLDNLVHEFNHALNSIHQELKIMEDKLYVRTGLTYIVYDAKTLMPIEKQDSSTLEEIINTKQTESVINIINSFSNYNIVNLEVINTLYSLEKSYKSNAYLLQSLVCKTLISNKTFFSTLEKLRFKGDIDVIENWFDDITNIPGSYKRLIDLLKDTLDYQLKLNDKKIKFFTIRKIKKLTQELINIINIFDNNCNYR